MKSIKSCRFSRITEREAVLRSGECFLLLVSFLAILCCGFLYSNVFLIWIFGVASVLVLLYGLVKIFVADDYFELRKFNEKGVIKIYIYKIKSENSKYRIFVKSLDGTDFFMIDRYEFFKIGEKRSWFIFSLKDDWYCQHFGEIVPLGKRLARGVFVDKYSDEDFFTINALSLKNEIKTYHADRYFFEKDELFIPDLKDDSKGVTDYVLIKVGDKYELISSLHIWKKKREMMLAGIEKYRNISFMEDGQNVVLVWDEQNNVYKEIYRGFNSVSSLKSLVKMENEGVPCKGEIYKFDRRRRTLSQVYKGLIVLIDEKKRLIFGEKETECFSY